jgi:hypothetical protein
VCRLFFIRRRSPKWFYIPVPGVKEKKAAVCGGYPWGRGKDLGLWRGGEEGPGIWWDAVLRWNDLPISFVVRDLSATTCKKIVNWIYIKNSSENPIVSSLLSMHRK